MQQRSAEPYLMIWQTRQMKIREKCDSEVYFLVGRKFARLPLLIIQVQTMILASTVRSVARLAATMRSVQSAASRRCIGGSGKHVLFEYKTAHRNNTPESQSGERSLTPGLAKVRAS